MADSNLVAAATEMERAYEGRPEGIVASAYLALRARAAELEEALEELADACEWNARDGYPPRPVTLETCAREARAALVAPRGEVTP